MEIYFSNQVEIVFKKCCFLLVVMFVGSSLGAADIKPNALPQFEGVKAVVLDEGIVIHPKNLLVKFNDLEDIHKFRNLVDENAIEIGKQYTLVPGLTLIKVTHDGIGNNDIAAIKDNLTLKKNEIIETKLVEYVEYDYLRELRKIPSDSAYTAGDLWGLHNTGQNRGTVDADIDAPEAWELTTGSEQVIVAVMDSGLHVTHQDLENQLWVNEDEVPNNGKDDDNDGYIDNIHGVAPMTGDGNLIDNVSHGTHVAGTSGASANDSGGHVGVAWNVKLMGIKVGEWWISTAATIDGIEFAADHGVTAPQLLYPLV
jgi:subtilisin family serine protease